MDEMVLRFPISRLYRDKLFVIGAVLPAVAGAALVCGFTGYYHYKDMVSCLYAKGLIFAASIE